MNNNSENRNIMPMQNPEIRRNNFDEVNLGYSQEQAVNEASRCLNCKNHPCMNGCPVMVKIPDFIHKIAEGDFDEAYNIINNDSALPAVCGRVCPQEQQCEKNCIRGIKGEPVAIGYLERFVADRHLQKNDEGIKQIKSNGHKVAVIGSGPAGLTCAGDLAKKGFDVTVYEALHMAGGVLSYGIPEFRLPKEIVKKEIEKLKAMDVKIETNVVIGRTFSIDELFDERGFEAVFIGSGAGQPVFMNIPGEGLKGVLSANEFLTRINLMKAYDEKFDTPVLPADRVAVIGGGNVAMDAARSALRLGASHVYIVYRRSENELPARKEEVMHAKEEGVEFVLLTSPTEIIGLSDPKDKNANGRVKAIKCVKMELGKPDESGRCKPIPVPGSEFEIEVDEVIMALGTQPNPLIKNTTKDLEINRRGGILVYDENGKTSRRGIFAGGDAVTGTATVIMAMGAGKKAAKAIEEFIGKEFTV